MKKLSRTGWMKATVLAALTWGMVADTTWAGATRTWTGSWDTLPANADDAIVIASGGNLTWNNTMPATVGSWTQAVGYAGTVTFQTVYGTNGFTNFTVSGNVTLSGGTWTHTANTGGETNRLRVTVGGNLFITNATINADGLGYASSQGRGYISGYGAVYGGTAPGNSDFALVNTNIYGSITAPANLGSGANGSGGGAILLTVSGTTTVASAGVITANASASGGGAAGSGGSVFLTTGWITGTGGTIRANSRGGSTAAGGSGGRVAIILTGAGADFSSWSGTNTAYGGDDAGPQPDGAAGTVYLKTTAGVDTLIIDNNNSVNIENSGNYYAPPFGQISTLLPNGVNLNGFASVIIRNKGVLGVSGGTTLDFSTFTPVLSGAASSYIAINNDANVTYPANWTIDNYTLFPQGITKTPVNVTIGTNGAMSQYRNNTTETYKLNLTISGNLTVMSNGTIFADAKGYMNATPGYGFGGGANGYGAAYGGTAPGGDGTLVNSNIFGSVFAPTNIGSSGNHGIGGGAIILTVGGTTTVASAGVITASSGGHTYGSGGAGGSIYLTTGWLTGGGTIKANGLYSGSFAAGGGGRVAIILTGPGADFSFWTGTNIAYGGASLYAAAAGTVYLKTTAGADTLIIDNNNALNTEQSESFPVPFGQISTLMPNGLNLNSISNVVIKNKGVLGVSGTTTLDFSTFSPTTYGPSSSYIAIDNDANVTYPANWTIGGYTLFVNNITPNKPVNVTIATNGSMSQYRNKSVETYKLNLTISGNLTVLSNGTISADALGYLYGKGPGVGSSSLGGVYGGTAAKSSSSGINTNTYGLILAPTNIGSGGSHGDGGGVLLLTVAGTTTVASAGIISANSGGHNYDSAGSGGSIYLRTGWLAGGGTIRANGLSSGASSTGGGGGGRVAIILTGAGASFSSWSGASTAYGGTANYAAAAGTVYREAAGSVGTGSVIVDNSATATNQTFTPLPAFGNSMENIGKTIWLTTNKARLALVASTNIASLTLNSNGFLELNGYTLTVKALTVTNKVYKSGTYGPHGTAIAALTDSGVSGKVIVNTGVNGTGVFFR